MPRSTVLAAADALFADASAPQAVSMDDVAAAAGVGKGTLFRAFGSRDGLLAAIFAARFEPVRLAIEEGGSPLGPGTAPLERLAAVVDAFLTFKLDHRHLTQAVEADVGRLFSSEDYHWMHDLLGGLIERVDPMVDADYVAHVLLGALRVDLVEGLLAQGRAPDDIRAQLRALIDKLVG